MNRIQDSKALELLRQKLNADKSEKTIVLPGGTCGIAKGAGKVSKAMAEKAQELNGHCEIKVTGCIGFCEVEPLVVILPERTTYIRVTEDDVPEIIESVKENKTVERLLYTDPVSKTIHKRLEDIPFYRKQLPLVFGKNIEIDPQSIFDYIAQRGYQALGKVLDGMESEEVIEIIKKAGLRGRGGGGFPTGKKWESSRRAKGDVTYVICNADEGDPGAYMDRAILEGNPHSVIEGMIIGAHAVGSHEGFIYVRQEYPLAVTLFSRALGQARECGLLGSNILDSGFNFDIKVAKGGGAFVCGESTALMASIEGRPGEPRAKHIHTVERGLRNKPTVLNNVETWANVPLIINGGWEWYSSIGTEKSKGTKVFSLVGKVNNTGLVEVPMGITLREIVFDIGGGIRKGKKLKAVQTGGPSGGCVPESLIDTPVDFDRLTEIGSMMGSGGMIVMDEDNCMVDIARYFVGFLRDESCGKCTPCREGLWQMHEILTSICEGKGKAGDIELLEELAWAMENGCLCQLGKTAANPLLTTLKYFGDEYKAHIEEKRCPAGVCKSLISFSIDEALCNGCGLCKLKCSVQAISGEKNEVHTIDQEKCIKCGICFEVCRFDAVKKE
jgi:NADH:ubiquinone oxidoreductase subunit F (NADH-binding)/(2Fe-2S) ferredoxin/Pyruvate/2-oxoacid:ferredoxin oxidoreductase delta subunit